MSSQDHAPDWDDEPIHTWFGLTYANYLVLPRALLQSMPGEWQRRFVACLTELQEACDKADIKPPADYWVRAVDERHRFIADPVPHYNRGRTRLLAEAGL